VVSRRELLAMAVAAAGGLALAACGGGNQPTASAAGSGAPLDDSNRLLIGANATDKLEGFLAASALIGPLHAWRVFDGAKMPSSWAEHPGSLTPRGVVSYPSIKPDAIADDAERLAALRGFAVGIPAGTRVIVHHEPENDMSGAEFTALFTEAYRALKGVNPSIEVGIANLGFQWQEGMASTADPSQWSPAAEVADFIGVDDYALKPHKVYDTLLADKPDFQRWYAWASTFGKPLEVLEFGRMADPNDTSVRPRVLLDSETWLRQHHFRGFLYWQNTGAAGDWRLDDPGSIEAWRSIASRSV
jgi:hypothetical protein